MIEVRNVSRAFGTVPVLRGIDLSLADNEIVCLLGPSGCGKTTLLRIIAGLERLDNGEVLLNGQNIATIPTHQRGFGLMFQDFALFPHMNVAANVAFGLRMQNAPTTVQRQRVSEMLELVGLSGFEQRDVARLSGGERQRVALARSLAPNPKLLMLDEPLGSLDAVLREELILELRTIIKRLGLTAIYVTHDQHEAFAIADRIAVMNKGLVEQFAAPPALYNHPASEFVSRFLGLDNVVPVISQQGSLVQTPVGNFEVAGQPHSLLLHTDYLSLTQPLASSTLQIPVEVIQSVFQGDSYRLQARHTSGTTLTVKAPAVAVVPQIGDTVIVYIAPQAVIPLNTI